MGSEQTSDRSMRRNLGSASLLRRSGEAQHDKQHLGGDLRRISVWVVLGRDFDNIAADDVETEAPLRIAKASAELKPPTSGVRRP